MLFRRERECIQQAIEDIVQSELIGITLAMILIHSQYFCNLGIRLLLSNERLWNRKIGPSRVRLIDKAQNDEICLVI